ncbi:MAG: SprA-related family protein [Desulfatibacillum sp.]|nr:SprA-related family protein [Desulfatibacillum sp.]
MNISSSQVTQAYQAYSPISGASREASQASPRLSPFDTEDKVDISTEGAALSRNQDDGRKNAVQGVTHSEGAKEADQAEAAHPGEASEAEHAGTSNKAELTEGEKEQVQELKKRDQEVRAHEAAHMAAGAGVVQSGASFSYQQGPDGKRYAVGGEVQVDTSRESEPEATVVKMQQVKRAALAPANPSGQDRSVAARASQILTEARAEMAENARSTGEGEDVGDTENASQAEESAVAPEPYPEQGKSAEVKDSGPDSATFVTVG